MKGKLIKFRTVVGMMAGDWWKEEQKVVFIQGSHEFITKIVGGLSSIGVTESDKLIVATNKRIRSLPISLKFLRINHSLIGGVTNTLSRIGISDGFVLENEKASQKNSIHRRLSGMVKVIQRASLCPPHKSGPVIASDQLMSLNDLVDATFCLPCIFNHDGKGYRKLISQEVLTAIDFPKGVCDSQTSDKILESLSQKEITNVVPMKVLQHVTSLLAPNKSDLPKGLESSTRKRIQLAPTVPNINLIYQEISQAKAAKNDDATANTKMWDDAVFKPPPDLSDEWKIVGRKDMTNDLELL